MLLWKRKRRLQQSVWWIGDMKFVQYWQQWRRRVNYCFAWTNWHYTRAPLHILRRNISGGIYVPVGCGCTTTSKVTYMWNWQDYCLYKECIVAFTDKNKAKHYVFQWKGFRIDPVCLNERLAGMSGGPLSRFHLRGHVLYRYLAKYRRVSNRKAAFLFDSRNANFFLLSGWSIFGGLHV